MGTFKCWTITVNVSSWQKQSNVTVTRHVSITLSNWIAAAVNLRVAKLWEPGFRALDLPAQTEFNVKLPIKVF